MKPRCSGKSNRALTLFEVLIVITMLMILAAFILPALKPHPTKAQRINCVNNLKQIGLAYRVWAGDNNDKYPMMVSVTNGGTMELATYDPEYLRDTFLVMSNELSTPRILHCPDDVHYEISSNDWSALTRSNISYFFGLNADQTFPQSILSGDDNLAVNGSPISSGLQDLPAKTPVAWTMDRHIKCGNIGLADGSAQQVTTYGLQQALQQTGFATNRLVFP